MKLFIDSADFSMIEKAKNMGFCDGVTTNPSLVAKSGKDFKVLIRDISDFIKAPVSAEVISTEFKDMMDEAKELSKISPYVVIKLPLTPAGLMACKELTHLGIQTNVTLCFQPGQALLAAKAGATYVSIFIGRLMDYGHNPSVVISEVKNIFSNYNFSTQILTASIRDPRQIIDSAIMGADACTFPPQFLDKLIAHPLTDKGLEIFLNDWNKKV